MFPENIVFILRKIVGTFSVFEMYKSVVFCDPVFCRRNNFYGIKIAGEVGCIFYFFVKTGIF